MLPRARDGVLFLALCAQSTVTGCGGVGAAPGSAAHHPLAQETGTLVVHLDLQHGSSSVQRLVKYVSAATHSMTITIAQNGAAIPGSTTVNCTLACNAEVAAPVGVDQLTIVLSDAANGGGNALSTSSTAATVIANATNALNLTANPVVDHVALTPASPTFPAGTNASEAVSVNAMDADGNVIIGPGVFVDSAGQTVTLSFAASNVQAGGSGTISLSPGTASAPGTSLTASYDGKWLDHTVIAVTASSALVTGLTGTAIATTPTVIVHPGTTAAQGGRIVSGPDGDLWFTEPAAGMIGKMTPGGSLSEYSAGISGAPNDIAAGPDGALWFTEPGTPAIGRITTAGLVTEYGGLASGAQPQTIVKGPDGNLWFVEYGTNAIGRISTSGAISEFAAPMSTTQFLPAPELAAGPDGNIWFAEDGNTGGIGKISTAGFVTHVPDGLNQHVALTAGTDGRLWTGSFCCSGYRAVRTDGSWTPYTPSIGGDSAITMTNGPDGNVWAGMRSSTLERITSSGTTTNFPVSHFLSDMTMGPDGNLWFTDASQNGIYSFVL